MKKQSFAAGAATLMIANALSKILGAVFKIPLTYIIREDGMAVFGVAFQVYIMFLTFIISGFPLAVSKIVSEKLARKDLRSAHNTVGVSAAVLCLIGLAGTAAMYFGAGFFSFAMKEEKAVFAIKCISPAVFFVAWGTAYKSYFQGSSNMLPTAAAQISEAFIKLAAGYFLASRFTDGGVYKSAGGAIGGVAVGELAASAMLMLMYYKSRLGIKLYYEQGERKAFLKEIADIAVPVIAASIISNALSVAETTIIRTQLLRAGFTADRARYLYGAYTGYAMTVFNLPVGILATLGISILPIISGAFASGNAARASHAASYGIRITLYLALPCAVIMYLLPNDILGILFRNTASADMLRAASPCIVLLCVSQMSSSVMQAAGKIREPIVYMFAGAAVRLVLSIFLVSKPDLNIYGAIIASNAGCFVTFLISTAAAKRYLNIKAELMSFFVKPLSAAVIMYAVIRLLEKPLFGLPLAVELFLRTAAGGIAYICVLLLSGAIDKNEYCKMRGAVI